MAFIELETQGDNHLALVNTEQITFITDTLYGASVHFTSGEYLVCTGTLAQVSERFSGKLTQPAPIAANRDYLVRETRSPD